MTRGPSRSIRVLRHWSDAVIRFLATTAGERFAAGPRGGAMLVILAAVVYLPGLFQLPAVDRDESRFAQASRQMFESVAIEPGRRDTEPFEITEHADGSTRVTVGLHTGGLAVPVLGHKPRLNKPPLIYWAQTGSTWMLTAGNPDRDAIWMYRLPSAVFAVLTVLITWRIGCSMFDSRGAFLGAALLAVCPMVVWDAHQARADQLLLMTTALTMWPLWLIFKARGIPSTELNLTKRWGLPLSLAIGLGAGVLTKGPITPLVMLLTALSASLAARDFRWLLRIRPVLILVVLAIMVGPWVYAVAQRVGFSTYLDIVLDETVGRSTSAKEGHRGPPGYHLLLSAVLFWPGSLLTAAAVLEATRSALKFPKPAAASPNRFARLLLMPARIRARGVGQDPELFLLAWLIPSWLMFEIVSTKLPHYTMPLYPAMALLTGQMLARVFVAPLEGKKHKKLLLGMRLWVLIGVVITVGLPLVFITQRPTLLAFVAAIGSATIGLVLFAAAWRSISANQIGHAQLTSIVALLVFVTLSFSVTLPGARSVWVTPALIRAIESASPDWATRPIAAAGYHEDSLMFATRGRLEKIRLREAQAWLIANPDGILIVPEALELTSVRRVSPNPVRGYNYSNGDRVSLVILEAVIEPGLSETTPSESESP